jgi:ADP-ribose pyrophosphatase YjhB (NUDIX family)
MSESIKVRVGVGAYIIRKTVSGAYQLLLFTHPDCPEYPVQVPAGGVDAGETTEQALLREIWEESGLTELRLIRKLGVSENCWIHPRKQISQRHYFLLEAPANTPNEWQQTVQGEGIDAGMVFSYFWHDCDRALALFPDAGGAFLYPEFIPELFSPKLLESTL